MKLPLIILVISALFFSSCNPQPDTDIMRVDRPAGDSNQFYTSNRAPLLPTPFAKLPVGSIVPEGWMYQQIDLQRKGLTGHLGEISAWLTRNDNAWINKDGKGAWGWEELPYWLKGYGDIAYVLHDSAMLKETKFWIENVLQNQRADGDFGPLVYRNGKRDFWTNMPMLWCLQSYYEYSKDERVIPFMKRYFDFERSVPDSMFLEDYWENSRGGDNLISVYWLYNRTGDSSLLNLAEKIHRNTANWEQSGNLPNWHNVNIAQCFREPATWYLQTHDSADLKATYTDHFFVREKYGQVPGGMFGADENAREGYDDPRQAIETCGMVEQMTSDQFLLRFTGDPFWADHCEEVAFNMYPAAFMPDYKSLRYLTAPNMVVSDGANHSPGIQNSGPFLMMNPFSSRCCQHNHAAGWIYYTENAWMATPDNGLAAQLYFPATITAKAGDGASVVLKVQTHYPFEDSIDIAVDPDKESTFPIYLRIPAWCKNPSLTVNGETSEVPTNGNGYVKLTRAWKKADKISLKLPMDLSVTTWQKNKNSVSVNYGPLTFSLKIQEDYKEEDSQTNAVWDSRWQPGADASKWPSYAIFAGSAWNYGLVCDTSNPGNSLTLEKRDWPADDNPFTNDHAPLILKATGKKIPSWGIDQYGLCAVLPKSPVSTNTEAESITLVPMGGARLRISAFPLVAK